MNLRDLTQLFVRAGCTRLYAKPLAENDNSKNQVYFGPGFDALNLLPNEGIVPDSSPKNPIFKARLRFGWLQATGDVAQADGAQLILYPQYPEVRFSGFLRGCAVAPSELMRSRLVGRTLFLGVSPRQGVVGFVVGADSPIAQEFRLAHPVPTQGVFHEVPLPTISSVEEARVALLTELGRIHRLAWIDSKQLGSDGTLKPCTAPQCGGFTLEAELGIAKNSQSEPDFKGWEVKQYAVSDFSRPESSKPITLMTPEPDGGFYKDGGFVAFMRRFGYPDRNGVPDRFNVGGRHYVGQVCAATKLALDLKGYDSTRCKITDANGCLALVSSTGEVAASWSFKKILEHWSHKHAKAAYVPSNCRDEPRRQYRYGPKVRLAERTDALRLLKALAERAVFYDPGIKLEAASSEKPVQKKRSQFRVPSKQIDSLYEKVTLETVGT